MKTANAPVTTRDRRRARGVRALRGRGFTLVEVLVALFIVAMLAVMSWRGIDGMFRARDISEEALGRSLRLTHVMAQWDQDLRMLQGTGEMPALNFDGTTLRLTRQTDAGMQVVAWSVRNGRWMRWASPATTSPATLQNVWMRSFVLLGTEDEQLSTIEGVEGWQIFFFRGNAWANAQSSGDLAAGGVGGVGGGGGAGGGTRAEGPAQELLPTGVRLVLTLQEGALNRDVMLSPNAQQPAT